MRAQPCLCINWMWHNDSLIMWLTYIFSSERKISQYSACVYFYMCVLVPVYVCQWIYVCALMCVSVYVCVHVCVLVYISVHVYACVVCGVCVSCMNVCMCVCQCVCMSHVTVCMCVLRCVSVCLHVFTCQKTSKSIWTLDYSYRRKNKVTRVVKGRLSTPSLS